MAEAAGTLGEDAAHISFNVQSFFVDDTGCLRSVVLPWRVAPEGPQCRRDGDGWLDLLFAVASVHGLCPRPVTVPEDAPTAPAPSVPVEPATGSRAPKGQPKGKQLAVPGEWRVHTLGCV